MQSFLESDFYRLDFKPFLENRKAALESGLKVNPCLADVKTSSDRLAQLQCYQSGRIDGLEEVMQEVDLWNQNSKQAEAALEKKGKIVI